MRVAIITGSRRFPAKRRNEIAAVLERAELVITGDAGGADRIAAELAFERGIPCLPLAALWHVFEHRAGPIRNDPIAVLVNLLRGAHDIDCNAYPLEDSSGTWDCVRKLKALGLAVRVHK